MEKLHQQTKSLTIESKETRTNTLVFTLSTLQMNVGHTLCHANRTLLLLFFVYTN